MTADWDKECVSLIYQHSTQKRDNEIAAGIDKRLAEAQSDED